MATNKMDSRKTICYFGIYHPVAPRDKVYLDGLKKKGVTVAECVDSSAGILKFFRLEKKHRALKGKYDILWVGYLSTMVVPLAWLISRKKIVFNALDSWYDRAILDRGMYSKFSPKAGAIWVSDFLAFHLSDVVLLESEQQKLFIAKKFFVNPKKIVVIFTGVDETVFHPDPSVKKADKFTVVFRGMFLPATGVEYIIEAARLLKDEDIQFRIIGWGEPIQSKLKKMISDYGLTNVNLTTVFLSPDELRTTILSAHVMLGQFGDHDRLNRTIQNKNIEALALGMPFITCDSASNRELLTSGKNCIFVLSVSPSTIASTIRVLRDDSLLRDCLATGAVHHHLLSCSQVILGDKVFSLL
ncbi:MAG: glycosyltransferase [Patescibacteria group bacterium]